jgi:hypothetical protein
MCLMGYDALGREIASNGHSQSYARPLPTPSGPITNTAPGDSSGNGTVSTWQPADPGVGFARPAIGAALDGDGHDLQRALLDWGLNDANDAETRPLVHGPSWESKPDTDQDRWCERSTPGTGLAAIDPDRAPFDLWDSYPASTIGHAEMRLGYQRATPYGYVNNFGIRKIAAVHGWSFDDKAETQVALGSAPVQTPMSPGIPPQWRAAGRYTFEGPEYAPSALATMAGICRRRVVVDTVATGSEPESRGIITSYGRFSPS